MSCALRRTVRSVLACLRAVPILESQARKPCWSCRSKERLVVPLPLLVYCGCCAPSWGIRVDMAILGDGISIDGDLNGGRGAQGGLEVRDLGRGAYGDGDGDGDLYSKLLIDGKKYKVG